MSAYTLTVYGECRPLDLADLSVDGARLMDRVDGPDARWTLEAGIWAASQEAAEALAEEVVAEAQWEYGDWHGWQVAPVAKADPSASEATS
jgi:hypothetical protein